MLFNIIWIIVDQDTHVSVKVYHEGNINEMIENKTIVSINITFTNVYRINSMLQRELNKQKWGDINWFSLNYKINISDIEFDNENYSINLRNVYGYLEIDDHKYLIKSNIYYSTFIFNNQETNKSFKLTINEILSNNEQNVISEITIMSNESIISWWSLVYILISTFSKIIYIRASKSFFPKPQRLNNWI